MSTKIILATTYAVNPYKGSEDGMGWNLILQIARYNKVYAVTRENNQKNIDRYIQENPSDLYHNITFLYFDLPYWMRFWKKGGRGAMLYYWMWQKGMVSFIKKQRIQFDIVHNVNFHNDWTPSYLWKLNKPFVWGPIGHHPSIPTTYLSFYSKKERIKDNLTGWIKRYFWNFSFSLKQTATKANHVLCMNQSVKEVLPQIKSKYSIMPSVATEDYGWNELKNKNKFHLISAGRLVALKGFDLTIQAFATFLQLRSETEKQNIHLHIIGSGPELSNYKDLCTKLNINQYVSFVSWIERTELLKIYGDSNAFLFPSHEGAGMVVAEAMSFGLPVICLDNCGPGEFIDESCGFKVTGNTYNETIEALSHAINTLYIDHNLQDKMSFAARKRFLTQFQWDNRGDQLRKIYDKL